MNAHVRLVSSEDTSGGADAHRSDDVAVARDDEPIGLPEERGTNPDEILGEAPPALVVEREDRPAGARGAKAGSNKAFAKLLALAWPPKTKPSTSIPADANEGERRDDGPSARGPVKADKAVTVEVNRAAAGVVAAPNTKRLFRRPNSALVAVLAAGVAIPAIVVLNWPRSGPPPIVEPGMLAGGRVKLMAPSAALATAPPREAPNVSRDRPIMHETRRDELSEMLSFKGAETTPAGGPPQASLSVASQAQPPGAVLPLAPEETTKAAGLTKVAATDVDAARTASRASAPLVEATALPVAQDAKPRTSVEAAKLVATAHEMAASQPAGLATSLPPASAQPQEAGLGEAAKIEARLTDLETALKDRSNEARARLEAEKAETHTLEKIAELGALVARLTGQVKDLQDKAQTIAADESEKLADLTRRVALGETDRAVASAEHAGAARIAPPSQENGTLKASEDAGRMGAKVVAADVKHNYRIQAASPGLAMLSVVDGSPDDRPVEVAIGTQIPGYGKVLSIEQHGEAWVVKADRGSIQ